MTDTCTSSRNLRPPWWLLAIAGALVLIIGVIYAFYFAFTRVPSQDEGYLMISIQGFLEGNPLYDRVFTQYGPFFYIHQWFLRGVLHIPLTHDATRFLCMFHWVAASAVLGTVAWKMTRSTAAGVFVFMQGVLHLRDVANEAGHPQEVVALLLAFGALTVLCKGVERGNWGWLAVATAALTLTKINVGVFFGFALFLAVRAHAEGRLARALNFLLLIACFFLPFFFMHRHIGLYWCLQYCVLMAVTLTAAFGIACRFSNKTSFPLGKYFKAAVCFTVPATLFVAVAVLTGSSIHGLLDGLILTPAKMPGVVLLPVELGTPVSINALAAALAALLVAVAWKYHFTRVAVSVAKLSFAVLGAIVWIGEPVTQFAYLLPWVWLVVVPTGNNLPLVSTATFPRLFLCLAAAAQPLQGYPVAGTQINVGTFFLLLAYTLCLADVCESLRLRERLAALFASKSSATMVFAQAAALAVLLGFFTFVWCRLPANRKMYAELTPLNLPGSKLLHINPAVAKTFQELSGYLATDCDTFITYPCHNSLYFWSGKRPPTLLNGTGWRQFTDAQQEEIIASVRKVARPRVVLIADFTANMHHYGHRADQIAPLIRFVSKECEERKWIGPFVVLEPKAAAKNLAGGVR